MSSVGTEQIYVGVHSTPHAKTNLLVPSKPLCSDKVLLACGPLNALYIQL